MKATMVRLGAVAWLCACGSSASDGGLPPSDVGLPTTGGVTDPNGAGALAGTGGGGGTGATGSGDQAPVNPTDPAMDPNLNPPTDPLMPVDEGCALALDECAIDTGWPGDELCILPPPPDMGFQVHIGPSNYDTPEAQYVLQPGQETDMHFPTTSGNTQDVHYYWRQYRMRAGSHHLILSASSGGAFGISRRLGGSSIAAKDNPECGIIAPENQGVGMPLAANASMDVNLHYFNVTGTGPVLQETWVNFWYRDPAVVTESTKEMFSMGGLAMAIQPGAHTVLGRYSCPVSQAGRVLTMYGHYHANTVRFSAWRVRGGQSELILEDYDWHEPLALEYSSIVENTPPDAATLTAGGHNGVLDLQAGDALEWECEVQNESGGVLRFTNEAVTGEMCILVGDTIGPSIACQFP